MSHPSQTPVSFPGQAQALPPTYSSIPQYATPVPQTPAPMYQPQPPQQNTTSSGFPTPIPPPAYGMIQQPMPQQPVPYQSYTQPPPGYPQPSPQTVIGTAMQQQGYPPEKVQLVQQAIQSLPPQEQQQYAQQAIQFAPPPTFATSSNASLPPTPSSTLPSPHPKDEKHSGGVKRFFGDTLVGRFARAGVQTISATAKMPTALSPWGDSSPIVLPNVRYRDAALFTTFAFVGAPLIEGMDGMVSDLFGADSFIAEVVSSGAGAVVGSTVLKYGAFQIVEQAIDKGIIEHMLPEEEKITTSTSSKTLQVTIKHKLMGVDADLRFHSVYPTTNSASHAKGWFCPYLFASARTPLIPRSNDFGIAQHFGPFLAGDYAMAHKLLAEASNILALCEASPATNINCNRMVLTFVAIAPFRAGMWSTSRRPGCGTLNVTLFNGCPALVLPVTSAAPIVAWSPWTLAQMRAGAFGSEHTPASAAAGGYKAEWQHEQICEWLDGIVSLEHLHPKLRDRYVDVLGRAVSLVVNGALSLGRDGASVLGKVDAERAGIVGFRY